MSKVVTCVHCKEKFDLDIEDYVIAGKRYAHKQCREEYEKKNKKKGGKKTPAKKTNTRICYYCSGAVDIDNEEYAKPRQNRYAHMECYKKNFKADDEYIEKMYVYLKELQIPYDYTQCERQRKNFLVKLGYTNEEIYLTIRYIYGIKRLSPEKSEGRIGLVPYLHDEAISYYKKIGSMQETIGEAFNKQMEQGEVVMHIKGKEPKRDKGYIDFDFLGGE